MNSDLQSGLTRSLVLIGLLLASCLPPAVIAKGPSKENLRVGVYFNPPLSFTDQNGQPAGFIIDLMDYIAQQEGWNLEYRSCTWDGCNELLVLGEIDMLSPIAANDAQQRRLDFNRESLFVNWGQIVTGDKVEIRSPLDLAGKSVIALSGDVHFADLKELAEHFDIDVRFLEVDEYEDVLAWVAQGPVDAGLINRSLDMNKFPRYKLEKSSVIFNPAEIRIALSPRNSQLTNALLIQRLDFHLASLKGNRDSLYYQLQERWFGGAEKSDIPVWVLWIFLVVASISLVLAAGVLVLRRQVRFQTHRIREISDRFSAFMNNLPGIAYMKSAEGRYIFVNPVWERTSHLSNAEVVGRMPEEIWLNHDKASLAPEERQSLESLQAVETIESTPWDDEASYWRLIRFPIRDGFGNAAMVGGIGLDITAQKDVEERNARLNRQLQLLLESAGEAIFGLDGLGRCIFINQVSLDLLGYRREEIIDHNMHDLIQHSRADGSTYRETDSPIYLAIREGSKSRVSEEVFWHAEGAPFAVEYSVHPIAEGEYPGAVVVFRKSPDQ